MPFVGVDSRVGAARSATVAAAPLQITPLFPESFPNRSRLRHPSKSSLCFPHIGATLKRPSPTYEGSR